VSDRAVREYLAELDTLGIIQSSEINHGKGGGKYKEHELNQSVESVKNGLSEFVDA
jgi:cell division control protein 6